AHRAHLDPCFYCLVELPDRSRRQQPHGFWLMMPSFRRFAFAFGTTFSVLYVIVLAKDLALFTVFPSLGVVLAGTHRSRDVAAPAMGFLAPAIYWYGWAATAALGALTFGLVAAVLPGRWTR